VGERERERDGEREKRATNVYIMTEQWVSTVEEKKNSIIKTFKKWQRIVLGWQIYTTIFFLFNIQNTNMTTYPQGP
jgi:hypothetical protein